MKHIKKLLILIAFITVAIHLSGHLAAHIMEPMGWDEYQLSGLPAISYMPSRVGQAPLSPNVTAPIP